MRHARCSRRAAVALGAAALAAALAPRALGAAREASGAPEAADLASAGDDWEGLLAPYPAAVGWVRVAGTRVDQPLMQADAGDPEFWLRHAPDGSADPEGSLFADARGDASTAAHVLAFGHHVGDSGRMLSDLHDAWEQGSFDALGPMTLYLRASGVVATLSPALAARVDRSNAAVQHFSFADDGSWGRFLAGLDSQASARAADAAGLEAGATRAVTLVTCSSDAPGRASRCAITFLGGAS